MERVVDGDTIISLIDQGFHVLKRQRVRLARVDTAPLRDPAGKQAKDLVRDTLAQVEFVVVKTNKVDLYGRYVGHIFYAPGVEDKQRCRDRLGASGGCASAHRATAFLR